jgi:hypothetical protein
MGNLPVIRAGGWHQLPPYGGLSTGTFAPNFGFAAPLWPGRACTFDSLAIEVTSTTTGSTRHGLYDDSGSAPANLIQEFGTTSNTSTGVKTLSFTALDLKPILYWLVFVNQGGASVGLRIRFTSSPFVSHLTALLNGDHACYSRSSFPAGALPASFGTITGTLTAPMTAVKLT